MENKKVTYEEYVAAIKVIKEYQLMIYNEANSLGLDELAKPAILDKKLYDTYLSVRSLNCLKNPNYIHKIGESEPKLVQAFTIRDLIKYTSDDLLKIGNFGQKSLLEVRQMLNEYGLHLK